MRHLLILSLLLLSLPVFAQTSLEPTWSFGVKTYYGDNRHQVNGILEQYHISNYQESPDIIQFGLFAKASFPSFSVRPELSFASTSYLLRLKNLNPALTATGISETDWKLRTSIERFREIELYLPLEKKISEFISVEVGAVVGRRIHIGKTASFIRPEDEILYSVSNSYHNWNFDWRVGASVGVGPLIFQMAYQANIVPLASEVKHAGNVYQLRQQTNQLMFGAGLQLFQL
ncbi:MAG: hypothetical protein ACLFUB_05035 [Cyclobacteriaceae bacterium]